MQPNAAERSGIISARIHIDSVRTQLRFCTWRVAVNDRPAEASLAGQEGFANPKKVVVGLRVEIFARVYPGMGKKILANFNISRECFKEVLVFLG